MVKCVFSCCDNKNGCFSTKPGLIFYSFDDVLPSTRQQWISIVARERHNPFFKPNRSSKICSEHFASYEYTSKILNNTAVPTLNIGLNDNVAIIADDDKVTTKKPEVVCVIENQIKQPTVYSDDKIICVIENQIITDPKPVAEPQNADIEDQIQWSLVGTSKHFNGLLRQDLKTSEIIRLPPSLPPQSLPPSSSTPQVQKKCYEDNDVILVEPETEHNDTETGAVNNNNKVYQDNFSQFLQNYCKVNLYQPRKKMKSDENATHKQLDSTPPPLNLTPQLPILTASKHSETIKHQFTQPALNQFTKDSLSTSIQKEKEETAEQPIPIQLVKTAKFTTPPFISLLTIVEKPLNSTPLKVCTDFTSMGNKTEFMTCVPSEISSNGITYPTVVLQKNNVKTYYLKNILPVSSVGEVNESDPLRIDILNSEQSLIFNNVSSDTHVNGEQGDEQFLPVIVKTENVSEF